MHAYFKENIFETAGLTRTELLGFGVGPGDFVEGVEKTGHGLQSMTRYHRVFGMGDGGLVAPAEDVALFFQALLVSGSLLSDEMLALMLRDPTGEGYGMGIEVETIPGIGRVVGHIGQPGAGRR